MHGILDGAKEHNDNKLKANAHMGTAGKNTTKA